MDRYREVELKGSFGQWIAHVLDCGYVSGSIEKFEAEFSHNGNRYFARYSETDDVIEVAIVDGPLHNYGHKEAAKMESKLNSYWERTFYYSDYQKEPSKEENVDENAVWQERYRLLKKAYDRLREENLHLKARQQKRGCHAKSEAKSTSFAP